MRCYIYIHIRLDNNEVFYVGRGTVNKKASGRCETNTYSRAYCQHRHNKIWMRITNKTSWRVEIIEDYLTWEDSLVKEKKYIKKYGRLDLNEGALVNFTDGGEGTFGMIPSELSISSLKKRMSSGQNPMKQEHNRKKISNLMKEKNPMFNPETKQKVRDSIKKYWSENIEKHPRKGIPREDLRLRNLENNPTNDPKVREKIRQSALLRNNKGGNNHSARKVKHVESGQEFNSIIECQMSLKISHSTVYRYLKNGKIIYLN